jgi:hypothetical protein
VFAVRTNRPAKDSGFAYSCEIANHLSGLTLILPLAYRRPTTGLRKSQAAFNKNVELSFFGVLSQFTSGCQTFAGGSQELRSASVNVLTLLCRQYDKQKQKNLQVRETLRNWSRPCLS